MSLPSVASAAPIPPEFLTVNDQQGANDVNSDQVDMTLMGRDESSATHARYIWSWDSTDSWTGSGQTGDACALYDTDGDGKINFAICAQVNNPTATTVEITEGSPFVFTCSDARSDRCSQPSNPLPYTAADITATSLTGGDNLVNDSDPFAAGDDFPNDSTILLTVRRGFLPAGAVLVNVCSYPSAGNGGNNNPFDCITPPSAGLLIIKKDAGSNTTTPFPFKVNPVPQGVEDDYTIVGTGQTAPISVLIGTTSVTETVPAGWALDSVSCTREGGGATGTRSGNAITGVAIESGKVTTCTFKDIQNNPLMTVDKNSTTTSVTGAGQVVPYTFVVTNTGNVTLTGITVTDPKVPSVSCPSTTLAPGAQMTCTGSHTVTQAEIDAGGTLSNTVTADSTQTPPTTDTHNIPIGQGPAMTVDKNSTTTSVTGAGQVVPYTFVVTNTGNVTLTGITVTDPKVPSVSCPSTTLAPGAQMTCTGSHTVTQAEIDAGGTLSNTVTADSTQTPPTTDTHNIPIAGAPAMTVDKNSTTTSVTGAGQVVQYTFVVRNTGNQTLTGITVTDPNATGISCPGTTLAPGAQMTCTGSHTVTQAEIDAGGTLSNTVTADSTQTPPTTDTHNIPITQTPAITVDKNSTTTSVTGAGQVVPYTFVVTNTGNVTLTGITVTDPKVPSVSCPSTTLAPGAQMTCTGSHTVTQAEIDAGGTLSNTVTADSTQTPPTTDTHNIPIGQGPAMTVDKNSTTTSVTGAGQVVPYTFVVRNTGNVTLTGITVTDPNATGISCPGTTLAPGAQMTCTGSHTVTQAEIDAGGTLSNTVTADSTQTPPTTDTHNIPIGQTPAMTVDKNSTTTSVTAAGQVVPYTFVVRNTGNVTLTGITVTDPKVPSVSCPATTLAPGAQMTCTGSHTVTQAEINAGGTLSNTVTADSTQTPPTTDTHNIPIVGSVLTITKTACPAPAVPGGVLTYTITVTASGVTANNVVITDTIPTGTSLVNAGGGSVSGNTITWNVPSVTTTQPVVKTVQVLVNVGNGSSLTNVATADADNAALVSTGNVVTQVSNAGAVTHGMAYGADADVLVLAVINELGRVDTDAPPSPDVKSNTVLPVSVPGIVEVGLINTGSASVITNSSARTTSVASVAEVSLLGGLIRASAVKGVSNSIATPFGASSNANGSTIGSLFINGLGNIPAAAIVPGAVFNVKGGLLGLETVASVKVLEETKSATLVNGKFTAAHSVNVLHVTLLKRLLGLVKGAEIIVSHANSDATYPSGFPCGAPVGTVSGKAFTAYADGVLAGTDVLDVEVGTAEITPFGGSAATTVATAVIPGVVFDTTVTNTAQGSLSPSPNATSRSITEGLNVLSGLVTADVLDVRATSTTPLSGATTTFQNTFVNLRVAGIPIAADVSPNTVITVQLTPLLKAVIIINEQTAFNSLKDTEGTINAVHVYLVGVGGLVEGEVIVASAHSDAHRV